MTTMTRAACPTCGRDVATYPRPEEDLVRYHRHNTPEGEPCPTTEAQLVDPQEEATHVSEPLREVLAAMRKAGRATRSKAKAEPIIGTIGRPPKLTPEVTLKVVEALLEGNYVETAARLAGISPSTMNNWRARGRAAEELMLNDQEIPDEEVPYLAFLVAVETARSDAEARMVSKVQTLAQGGELKARIVRESEDGSVEVVAEEFYRPSVPALTWWLERSFPDRWGIRKVELGGPDGGPIPVEVEVSARTKLEEALDEVFDRMDDQEAQAS